MGVVNITDYTSIETLLSNPVDYGTFGNLAEALETNPGWRVIEGGKTVVNPTGSTIVRFPISQYGQEAVNLTGGVEGYSNIVNITEGATAGTVAAESAGIFAGWTVGTAVAGVLAGAGIGIAAFELAPEFWIGVSNRIFGTDITYDEIKDYTILGRIQNKIIGGQNQVTTYLSTEIIKAILEYAAEYGLFDSSGPGTATNPEYPTLNPIISKNYSVVYYNESAFEMKAEQGDMYMIALRSSSLANTFAFIILSSSPGSFAYYINGRKYATTELGSSTSPEGRTFYVGATSSGGAGTQILEYNPYLNSDTNFYNLFFNDYGALWDFLQDGTIDFPTAEGTYEIPGNPTLYDPNKTFEQNYPEWAAEEEETAGLINPYTNPETYPQPWLPVIMPEYDPVTQPERYPAYEPGTEPYPEGLPESQPDAQRGKLPRYLPDPYQEPTTNIPGASKNPTTGDPDVPDQNPPTNPTPTPPIVFPLVGGEANALFTVYEPDTTQLNSLAGVLWSSNFLDNLIKIFTNNPMDAIISLHMLYATPHTGGNKNIKLGYLDTGISSLYVDKQYLQIDCGTVRIPEYFGDVRDYVNSVVDCYLPFIGMRHLKTQDIVGSYVTIKAGIDVFTGTILYTINIRKSSGIDQVMYAFEGNCAVALPLTGADKSRMFSVLGAAATGGAVGGAGGAVVGAFTSVMNGSQQADIQRTGNFGANSGAMGVKKPYIVVSRNINGDADSYNHYHGYPANKTVTLGSCLGFTRVLDVRVDNISEATDREKKLIESALKNGVVI